MAAAAAFIQCQLLQVDHLAPALREGTLAAAAAAVI
jgi:hypothetical protein